MLFPALEVSGEFRGLEFWAFDDHLKVDKRIRSSIKKMNVAFPIFYSLPMMFGGKLKRREEIRCLDDVFWRLFDRDS
jgi:hypothetical protein